MDEHEIFQVGQKAVVMHDGKCLVMESSWKPGLWDLPGGRINRGEDGDRAFRRELEEEAGIQDFLTLGVVDYDVWMRTDKMPILLVAQLLECKSAAVTLSHEHSAFRWVTLQELEGYPFVWPTLKRMIKNGFRLYELLRNKNE